MKLEMHLLMMWNSNIKSYILRIFFILCCFHAIVAQAADKTAKIEENVRYDSSAITVRKISSAEVDALRNDPDYNYLQENTQPKTTWERFKEWFWSKITELFDSQSGNTSIRIIRYVFLSIVIALIIFLLFKNKTSALFYGKSASSAPDFIETIEDIQELDFDKRIAEEVSKRDFRRAVRLYFLKVIKDLSQQNLINWKQDKTNADYLKELKNSKYQKQFHELVKLYEYVWYGDFKLDELSFQAIIERFNQFKIDRFTDVKRG